MKFLVSVMNGVVLYMYRYKAPVSLYIPRMHVSNPGLPLYMPSPMSALVNRSAVASGSCLAISTMLSSFLMPTLVRADSASSSVCANPTCPSMLIARRRSSSDRKSCTSRSTMSSARRDASGGTRSSASKISLSPRSVRTGRRDEVAMMSRRRPCGVCEVGNEHICG